MSTTEAFTPHSPLGVKGWGQWGVGTPAYKSLVEWNIVCVCLHVCDCAQMDRQQVEGSKEVTETEKEEEKIKKIETPDTVALLLTVFIFIRVFMDVGLEEENFKKRESSDKCGTPVEEFLRCLGEKPKEVCRDWFPQTLVDRPTENVRVH